MTHILHSLKSLHTFSLNAYCSELKTADSVDSLIHSVKTLEGSSFLIIGEGSNTVFVEDYPHTVLRIQIKGIELGEDAHAYTLAVGAGENWHQLVEFCMANHIGGFENLALIPGTVGAAPIQNIGAYGVEIERFIDKVEYFDCQSQSIRTLNRDECEFAYRDSVFKRQSFNARVITRVFFKLPKTYALETSYGPLKALENNHHHGGISALDVYHKVINVRRSKLPDPAKLGNAGSFFKNPVIKKMHYERIKNLALSSAKAHASDSKSVEPTNAMPCYKVSADEVKVPAAWLIDYLGFKGKRVGDIACHIDQPLVLLNCGGGEGKDLLALAREIKSKVKAHFDIELENEVRLIGQDGLITL